MPSDSEMNSDFNEMMIEARDHIEHCKKLDAAHRLSQRAEWDELVGAPRVDILLQDRSAAFQCLFSSHRAARLAGLSILRSHWKPDAEFSTICERLALHDSDLGVRACALVCLGSCYSKTSDRRIGRLLADIVYDESQATKIREFAYMAMFPVFAVPSYPSPMEAMVNGTFRIPDDVNWSFVDSIRSGEYPVP